MGVSRTRQTALRRPATPRFLRLLGSRWKLARTPQFLTKHAQYVQRARYHDIVALRVLEAPEKADRLLVAFPAPIVHSTTFVLLPWAPTLEADIQPLLSAAGSLEPRDQAPWKPSARLRDRPQ
ncbi:hypothetical protein K466DRAFT_266247 [Polyporus arcularius HHB13444]|uniref:Uncharacterized protein n=1 Tax=Polyporus arcularius HHB13444 TaxID=1314778 RepID=A0A5C3PQG0_9APHY|nr:hypothetical protein K466DRAFT_266247 [Polyporus arcularius HHB13444]